MKPVSPCTNTTTIIIMSEPQSSTSSSSVNPAVAPQDAIVPEDANTQPSAVDAGTPAPANSSQPSFKVFRPSASSPASLPSLSDEYFNPTASEVRLQQQQLTARVQAMTNAPLQLKATREAAEKEKRDRWPEVRKLPSFSGFHSLTEVNYMNVKTKIRVKFPDRTQLEKVFPSSDKIKSVYAFVRNSLREDVKPIKFILYQPPQRDLKVSDMKVKNLSLVELQLAPSSVLLLRFEDESLNGTTVPAPLAPEVLALAQDLPAPPPEMSPTPTEKEESKTIGRTLGSIASGEKVPKWLKLSKK
ncbi:hypothetical protein L218DRAFT_1073782 [Marasmius fiardii PR-910]|nr:hypothetical protein L218DRAFT_1073782 [Marasmius fiardii PR-910]